MDLAGLAQYYMKSEGKLMYMNKIIFKIISLEDIVHFRCKTRSRGHMILMTFNHQKILKKQSTNLLKGVI